MLDLLGLPHNAMHSPVVIAIYMQVVGIWNATLSLEDLLTNLKHTFLESLYLHTRNLLPTYNYCILYILVATGYIYIYIYIYSYIASWLPPNAS